MNFHNYRYANFFTNLTISATLLILMLGLFIVAARAADEETSLTLVNATSVDICTVTAKDISTDEFFENILGAPLAPGESDVITGLEPQIVDLVALDCDGGIINASSETLVEGAFIYSRRGYALLRCQDHILVADLAFTGNFMGDKFTDRPV